MLELLNIKKDYPTGNETVHALKGVSIRFRKSEFVSILGPSGCGKTTMLNIIGGLDGYTEGDLVINGKSTKEYKDRDWDTYRNHSVGFVFQSYNLIPHQTVLGNVELALTLSGVSKAERRERAAKALAAVGLGDQLKKKPSEMSGGQMQRVAIARALVNNPDIILADEPTGALDTETSVQVMEILKEVSKDRLVVMVTHNPELAEQYSSRIIRMVDGLLLSDSNPLSEEEYREETEAALAAENQELLAAEGKKSRKPKKQKKPSMSFFTAFMLSLKNLITKKGRTTLTAFAGSIGIIGIALILSVSQGMSAYIAHVQETTLSSYPLTLEETNVNISALMESFMGVGEDRVEHPNDAVYKDPIIAELVEALSKMEVNQNDLAAFKTYLEAEMAKEDSPLKGAINGIQYTYALNLAIYTKNLEGQIIKSDVNELMMEMIGDYMMAVGASGGGMSAASGDSSQSSGMGGGMFSMMGGVNMWQELLPGLEVGDAINDTIEEQYELVHGTWPNEKDEIVLILNENNEIDDLTLYALGLLSKADIDAIINAAASGTTLPPDDKHWSYDEICNMTFRTIFPYDFYTEIGGVWVDASESENILKMLYNDAMELRVVGIIRPDPDAENAMLRGTIGYTHMLTEHIILSAANSDVVKAQLANPDIDVLTGLPFESTTGNLSLEEKAEAFRLYVASLPEKDRARVYFDIQCLIAQRTDNALENGVNGILATMTDKDAIVEQLTAVLAGEMGGGADKIRVYLAAMSLEELQEMMRPGVEEQVKAHIAMQVEMAMGNMGLADDASRASALELFMSSADEESLALYYDEITEFSENTYEETMKKLGNLDLSSPSGINLYATSFENKDVIVAAIDRYNAGVAEEQRISYTDYLGIMMSSITTIINAITYVLVAFVAISLVVSSIMIGVITLISVQERTKEIGILRAIGASKRNVSSMFNAETVIVGLAAGLLGVLVTYLLCIPINLILYSLTGLANLKAVLPIGAAVILVAISVLLTLISGIIPSRSAAKKDPVVALRTE